MSLKKTILMLLKGTLFTALLSACNEKGGPLPFNMTPTASQQLSADRNSTATREIWSLGCWMGDVRKCYQEQCDYLKNDQRFIQLFEEKYYLRNNPDVAQAVANRSVASAATHFLCSGQKEGRKPNPFFDENYYLQNNGDVATQVSLGTYPAGFHHFVLYGQLEGRRPIPSVKAWTTPNDGPYLALFDENYYRQNNPDVSQCIQLKNCASGLAHYIKSGAREGRRPSAAWNEIRYLNLNPDIKSAVRNGDYLSGLEHYIRFGQNESGRLPFAADMLTAPGTPNTGLAPKALVLPNGDILRMLRSQTNSGKVEAELISKASGFKTIVKRYEMPYDLIPGAACIWELRETDLVCILTGSTGSGAVELHGFSQASGYQQSNMHVATGLEAVDGLNFDFRFLAGNLVAIKRRNAESGTVEIHILSQSSSYWNFLLHTATPLGLEDGVNFEFFLTARELVAVKRTNTGSGRVEMHALTRDSGFQIFNLHAATAVNCINPTATQIQVTPERDLLLISKTGPIPTVKRLPNSLGYSVVQ